MRNMIQVADYLPKLREVAAFLPKGWTMQEPKRDEDGNDYNRVTFQHEDGRKFDIISNWDHAGKFFISGDFHRMGKDGKTSGYDRMHTSKPRPSINVSPDRSADVIARDIERRFLPAFTELWLEVSERIKAQEDYERNSDDNALRVAVAFGISPDDTRNIRRRDDYNLRRNGEPVTTPITSVTLGGFGDVKPSGDSVKLELQVSPELGAKIARLLAREITKQARED